MGEFLLFSERECDWRFGLAGDILMATREIGFEVMCRIFLEGGEKIGYFLTEIGDHKVYFFEDLLH